MGRAAQCISVFTCIDSKSRSLPGLQGIFVRKKNKESLSALAEVKQMTSELSIFNTEHVTLMSQPSASRCPTLICMAFSH